MMESVRESLDRMDLRADQVFAFLWAILGFLIGLPLISALYQLIVGLAEGLGASGSTLVLFEVFASGLALAGFAALVWGLFHWVKAGGPGFVR